MAFGSSLAITRARRFLVPAGWTGGNEDLVVLLADDDPAIRVDLRP